MNGRIRSVWDTNAVIGWLKGDPSVRRFVEESGLASEVAVSQITRMELLARRGLDEEDLRGITMFRERSTVMPITPDVEGQAIDLRRSSGVKLPDAIIAATAVVLNCPLLTSDQELTRKLSPRVSVLSPLAQTDVASDREQESGGNSAS